MENPMTPESKRQTSKDLKVEFLGTKTTTSHESFRLTVSEYFEEGGQSCPELGIDVVLSS